MFGSTFYPITLLITFAGLISAQQLTLLEPSSDRWWVANSQNTLRWNGTTPAEFSVFVSNPDVNLLTSKLALVSVQPLYEYSKTIVPTLKAGTGYIMELTNILNSSDIYVKSQPFEVKAVGSNYPPQTTAGGASATPSGSGTASSSGSAAAASSSRAAGERSVLGMGVVGVLGAGAAVAGLVCL